MARALDCAPSPKEWKPPTRPRPCSPSAAGSARAFCSPRRPRPRPCSPTCAPGSATPAWRWSTAPRGFRRREPDVSDPVHGRPPARPGPELRAHRTAARSTGPTCAHADEHRRPVTRRRAHPPGKGYCGLGRFCAERGAARRCPRDIGPARKLDPCSGVQLPMLFSRCLNLERSGLERSAGGGRVAIRATRVLHTRR